MKVSESIAQSLVLIVWVILHHDLGPHIRFYIFIFFNHAFEKNDLLVKRTEFYASIASKRIASDQKLAILRVPSLGFT